MLGTKNTCHVEGACGANGAAPSAATRDEVLIRLYESGPTPMALSSGTRLGSYEIAAQIGVGGIGEM